MSRIPHKSGRLPYAGGGYAPYDLPGYKGGGNGAAAASFDPESLFDGGVVGDYWQTGELTTLFEASNGSGSSLADIAEGSRDGTPIGRWNGSRGVWYVSQADTGTKPLWNQTNKSVKSLEAKFLTNTNQLIPASSSIDATVFAYYKREGVAGAGNNAYIACTRYNEYANSFGFRQGFDGYRGTSYALGNGAGLPNETDWNSMALITGTSNAEVYINDEGLNRNSGGSAFSDAQLTESGGGSDMLFSYTDEAGRYYHMKFILLIRRALTVDEVNDLYAYASALP